MSSPDVRWKQRFSNYKKALAQLTEFFEQESLNKFEQQGLIQAFEYTHELAWNVLKDYLGYQGTQNIYGSRDATRIAFNRGLIEDGESWMEMIKDRNQTSHTYNQDTAASIANNVRLRYFPAFESLRETMEEIANAV
ncbi:MAG: nucleotidyltransferase substrate binding protein [Cyanobacteria bacterium J06626_18]